MDTVLGDYISTSAYQLELPPAVSCNSSHGGSRSPYHAGPSPRDFGDRQRPRACSFTAFVLEGLDQSRDGQETPPRAMTRRCQVTVSRGLQEFSFFPPLPLLPANSQLIYAKQTLWRSPLTKKRCMANKAKSTQPFLSRKCWQGTRQIWLAQDEGRTKESEPHTSLQVSAGTDTPWQFQPNSSLGLAGLSGCKSQQENSGGSKCINGTFCITSLCLAQIIKREELLGFATALHRSTEVLSMKNCSHATHLMKGIVQYMTRRLSTDGGKKLLTSVMGSEVEDCRALQGPPALFFLHSLHFQQGILIFRQHLIGESARVRVHAPILKKSLIYEESTTSINYSTG